MGLVSIFLPPIGLVAAVRLARPGSIWAQLFYDDEQRRRALVRFDPATSRLERFRRRFTDLIGGSHDSSHDSAA